MDEDGLERERWDQHCRAAVSESICPYHRTPLVLWVHTDETWLACLACGVSRIPRPGSETGVGMISCVPGECVCSVLQAGSRG